MTAVKRDKLIGTGKLFFAELKPLNLVTALQAHMAQYAVHMFALGRAQS